ncbi:Uncharacterised protein [Mycobacteroides abscessus subsp. abscessus]|nr:Uncharacterised protein [Mycobacteroides abscessus subsp. abscessus]
MPWPVVVNPVRTPAIVDLPDPDSPTMPSVVPRATSRLTSLTACTTSRPVEVRTANLTSRSEMLTRGVVAVSFSDSRSVSSRSSTFDNSGRDANSSRVYSCCGLANISATSPVSTTSPCRRTTTRSAIRPITPRSWLIHTTAMPRSRCSRATRSMIWACVVTSSAVVASSATRTSGSQESAIAIITRCR